MDAIANHSLLDTLTNLSSIFKDTCQCIHILQLRKQQNKRYAPTHFMYMFFFFNTLYNIDWDNSIKEKVIKLHPQNESEAYKIDKAIEFSFSEKSASNIFVDRFTEIICTSSNKDVIDGKLKGIVPDVNTNGNVKESNDGHHISIGSFQRTINEVLVHKNFTKENIKKIILFIYGVRCNIFHGIKDLSMLNQQNQQERLEIYTNILRAMNTMILDSARKQLNLNNLHT